MAGGYHDGYIKSVEILSLEDMSWRMAAHDLPYGMAFGGSIQWDQTFLAVGGYRLNTDGFGYSGKIFRYEPETESWTEMPQELSIPRREFTAFLVPENFVQCQLTR